MPRPPGGTSGFEPYQFEVAVGSIALNPPSPPSTLSQLELVVAWLVAGKPLPCALPKIVLASVGCWEKVMNCVIEPRSWLRSSNWFGPLHDPVLRPEYPLSAR